MNSMVKIPRQFETFLDVGLQGFAPGLYWGVFTVCSQATSCIPWMYVIKSHKEKSLLFYRHPNSNLILYILGLKLLLRGYIFYLLQVKSSNKRKIKQLIY